MNFFRRHLVGVDVGSRTVKAVSLARRRGKVFLDRYFFYDLAATTPAFPVGADPAEALRAGVELQGFARRTFAAGVPDRDVIHLNLELDVLKPAELRLAVKHELAELTGIDAEDLAFDFTVEKQGADKLEVSAYGASRRQVSSLSESLRKAGLRPARAEPDTLAIAAALEFNGYLEAGQSYALFDLGESHLTAALVANGSVRLAKTAPLGWGSINQRLYERFGLTYAEAEAHKKRYDFNGSDPADREVDQAMDEAYAALFSEVKQALETFADYDANLPPVGQLLLTGGASQSPNLPRVLEMFFKIPAVVANPFRKIELYADGSSSPAIALAAPHLMAAVGLALTSFEKEAA